MLTGRTSVRLRDWLKLLGRIPVIESCWLYKQRGETHMLRVAYNGMPCAILGLCLQEWHHQRLNQEPAEPLNVNLWTLSQNKLLLMKCFRPAFIIIKKSWLREASNQATPTGTGGKGSIEILLSLTKGLGRGQVIKAENKFHHTPLFQPNTT